MTLLIIVFFNILSFFFYFRLLEKILFRKKETNISIISDAFLLLPLKTETRILMAILVILNCLFVIDSFDILYEYMN